MLGGIVNIKGFNLENGGWIQWKMVRIQGEVGKERNGKSTFRRFLGSKWRHWMFIPSIHYAPQLT